MNEMGFRRSGLIGLGVLGVLATGCSQYVEKSADFGHLSGPATAVRNQAVTIDAWLWPGSDGCDSLGSVRAHVQDKQVTIKAVVIRDVSYGRMCSLMAIGLTRVQVVFTPTATGTYQIKAERYREPNYLAEYLGTAPQHVLSLEVTN